MRAEVELLFPMGTALRWKNSFPNLKAIHISHRVTNEYTECEYADVAHAHRPRPTGNRV